RVKDDGCLIRPSTTSTQRTESAASAPPAAGDINWFAGRSAGQVSTMILPQVHLRKPCYDFYFL
ncbi:hypothetical protein CEJ77_20315, partial [Acinetobacter baumannii]